MSTEIKLPKLSETMEEGTLLRWLKKVGETIQAGDAIAEVETDKADMEVEADVAGVLQEIRVQEGESVQVGSVLAIVDSIGQPTVAVEAGVSSGALPPAGRPEQTKSSPPIVAKKEPPTARTASHTVRPPTRRVDVKEPPPQSIQETPRPGDASDQESAAPSRPTTSKLRAAVAKQMVASKRDVPHFYVSTEIDMSEAARMREALSETAEFPERLTYTHILLRALARTLPNHPRVNASWSEEGVLLYSHVHLGIAVAVDDGLLAPVLRDCQDRSLRNLARAATQLVEKAKSGRSDKLTGATFTLSNLGMLDVDEFSAVITPPQAAILAVGAIRERAVVRHGTLAVAKTMRATLSADHRVLTGYEAGKFLTDLKATLEAPYRLLLQEEEVESPD